jgi:tetratricopeptide (TPR) repeat protein
MISEHSPGRFAFHDLLRTYAADLADETDTDAERHEAVHRVLDHYLHTSYAGTKALNPMRLRFPLPPSPPGVVPEAVTSPAAAMAWFNAERQVLIAATTQASDLGFDRHAWQLPWALTLYLTRKGYWQDLLASQRGAIAAAERLDDLAAQAHACRDLGWAKLHLGAFTEALDCFLRALDMHTKLGDQAGQALAHHDIAVADEKLGRFSQALEHAQQSLALIPAEGDQAARAKGINAVGWLHAQLGDYRQGLAYCQQALRLIRGLDDPINEAAILDSIGYALTHMGRHTEAIDRLRTAASMLEGMRAPQWQVDMLIHLGDACVAGGRPEEGHRAWRDALAIMDSLQHPDADEFRAKLAQFHVAPLTQDP